MSILQGESRPQTHVPVSVSLRSITSNVIGISLLQWLMVEHLDRYSRYSCLVFFRPDVPCYNSVVGGWPWQHGTSMLRTSMLSSRHEHCHCHRTEQKDRHNFTYWLL